jgi:hypothetical protein
MLRSPDSSIPCDLYNKAASTADREWCSQIPADCPCASAGLPQAPRERSCKVGVDILQKALPTLNRLRVFLANNAASKKVERIVSPKIKASVQFNSHTENTSVSSILSVGK